MSQKTDEPKQEQAISFKLLNTDLLKWMIVGVFVVGQSWASKNYVPRAEFETYKQVAAREVDDQVHKVREDHTKTEADLSAKVRQFDDLLRTFQSSVVSLQGDKTPQYLSDRMASVETELRELSAKLNQLIGYLGDRSTTSK